MYFYEDRRFFSSSINNVNLKHYTVAFSDNPTLSDNNKEEPKHKINEELEAKYERVTDSRSKIKSTVWRTIPQVSKYRLIVYKFIRW